MHKCDQKLSARDRRARASCWKEPSKQQDITISTSSCLHQKKSAAAVREEAQAQIASVYIPDPSPVVRCEPRKEVNLVVLK